MTQPQAYRILLTAFRALTQTQRKRLAEHARRGTGICCGPEFFYFTHRGSG